MDSDASDGIAQTVPNLADRFQRRGEAVAAGEARVADALVLREQAIVAEHGIGDRAGTGECRQHAVSGEALQPEALAAAADVRRASHADVDVAAPRVVERHAVQLRKHAFEVRARRRRDVGGYAAEIRAAAAEQQAVVGAQAEVVGHELVVDHATVPRQQRARDVRCERRGRDLIGADRQQPARQRRIEPVDVRVAREHEHVRAHFAMRGASDVAAGRLATIEHAALLEDAAAGPLDRLRETERELQRIQMAGLGIVERGEIARAADPLGHLVLPDHAQPVVAPALRRFVSSLCERRDATRAHRGPQAAGPVVDVEPVTRGQFAHFGRGPAHAVPQQARAIAAERILERLHVARPAEQRLTAVAARCGPRDAARLEHDHALAREREPQRRVQPAKARADDQHVGVDTFAQFGPPRDRRRVGAGIVACDVTVGLHEHAGSREIFDVQFHEKLARQFHGSKGDRAAGRREQSDELKLRSFQGGAVRFNNSHESSNFGCQTRPRKKARIRRAPPRLCVWLKYSDQGTIDAPLRRLQVICLVYRESTTSKEYGGSRHGGSKIKVHSSCRGWN